MRDLPAITEAQIERLASLEDRVRATREAFELGLATEPELRDAQGEFGYQLGGVAGLLARGALREGLGVLRGPSDKGGGIGSPEGPDEPLEATTPGGPGRRIRGEIETGREEAERDAAEMRGRLETREGRGAQLRTEAAPQGFAVEGGADAQNFWSDPNAGRALSDRERAFIHDELTARNPGSTIEVTPAPAPGGAPGGRPHRRPSLGGQEPRRASRCRGDDAQGTIQRAL